MRNRIIKTGQCVALFLLVLFVHANCRVNANPDSNWTVFTAKSLLEEGNLDLNEFPQAVERVGEYSLISHKDKIYNYFPIGTSFLMLPSVYLYTHFPRSFIRFAPGFSRYRPALIKDALPDVIRVRKELERLTASSIIALATVVVFLIALLRVSTPWAFILSCCFAFGTSAWSVASRAMWQHGASILFLSITLYFLLLGKKNRSFLALTALPLACAFVVRPTNAVSILGVSFYILFFYRDVFIRFVLWSLPIAIPFIVMNLYVYDSLLPPYYFPSRVGEVAQFSTAFAGNLFSPARGLFVFSPVLLLSLGSLFLLWRKRELETLDVLLCGIIIVHLIIIATFPRWWGGHSYGPRLSSDMLPFLLFFLVRLVEQMKGYELQGQRISTLIFLVLMAFSSYVHYRGANVWAVHLWNSDPMDVDVHQERIWDWSDPQFLRS